MSLNLSLPLFDFLSLCLRLASVLACLFCSLILIRHLFISITRRRRAFRHRLQLIEGVFHQECFFIFLGVCLQYFPPLVFAEPKMRLTAQTHTRIVWLRRVQTQLNSNSCHAARIQSRLVHPFFWGAGAFTGPLLAGLHLPCPSKVCRRNVYRPYTRSSKFWKSFVWEVWPSLFPSQTSSLYWFIFPQCCFFLITGCPHCSRAPQTAKQFKGGGGRIGTSWRSTGLSLKHWEHGLKILCQLKDALQNNKERTK